MLGEDLIDNWSTIEGESAPNETQVSPGKLYRAALLKSRFADTILKAREKTLSQVQEFFILSSSWGISVVSQPEQFFEWFKQGDKGDPEKLRREREELEMHRRKGIDLSFNSALISSFKLSIKKF